MLTLRMLMLMIMLLILLRNILTLNRTMKLMHIVGTHYDELQPGINRLGYYDQRIFTSRLPGGSPPGATAAKASGNATPRPIRTRTRTRQDRI